MRSLLLLLLLSGCPRAPIDAPPTTGSAAEQQYGACRARVEGRESAGECASDTGCVPAGCSSEVCLPVGLAEGFSSTCDRLDCFEVLDRCGCHDGICTWTLKEG